MVRIQVIILSILSIAPISLRAEQESSILEGRVSIEEFLEYALINNFEIKQAKERIKEQDGYDLFLRSKRLPQLALNSQYTEQDEALSMFTYREGDWSLSLQATQALYSGGRIRSKIKEQLNLKEAAIAELRVHIETTLQTVKKSYYQVLLASDNIAVQEQNITLLSEQLKIIENRLESGASSKFDVLQAKVALANAKPQRIEAYNAYRIAIAELKESIGDTSKVAYPVTEIQFTAPPKVKRPTYDLEASLNLASKRRPEIVRQSMRIKSLEETVKLSKAGLRPTIDLTAGYGLKRSFKSSDGRFDSPVDGWTVGIVSNWNLWDGKGTRGTIQQAESKLRQSQIELQRIHQSIAVEVKRAVSELESAQELLKATRQATALAEESLALAKQRYELGMSTYLENLQSRLALTEARFNKVQARYKYLSAIADLDRAIGGMSAGTSQL